MALLRHSYQVSSLGNCAVTLPDKTDLSNLHCVSPIQIYNSLHSAVTDEEPYCKVGIKSFKHVVTC